MKSLKLAVIASSIIVSAAMLSVAGLAQAESSTISHEESANRLNHNFNSKRPYHAPVNNTNPTKGDTQWEGATLVPEDENSAASKNSRNLKQLKINSLSRQPYMPIAE